MSSDGFTYILDRHVITATRQGARFRPIKTKRVTPHVIRHSTAMTILDATGYWHLVFTLPHELNPIAQARPALIYKLLFKAGAARHPEGLDGARTWDWLGHADLKTTEVYLRASPAKN